MLDDFYITIFNHYKKTLGKKSLTLALVYINGLELAIILVLSSFFMAFTSQMKMELLSKTKFWVLLGLVSLFVLFKNWMRYNGKKRIILNSKQKAKQLPIYLLWILPFGCIALALLFIQAF